MVRLNRPSQRSWLGYVKGYIDIVYAISDRYGTDEDHFLIFCDSQLSVYGLQKKVYILSRDHQEEEKTVADYREQKTSGISESPKFGVGESKHYFESLFSSPDATLLGWSPPHEYPRGIELFLQHSPADHVYFIERGIVKLTCTGLGAEEVIVSLRRKNWLLAAPSVILGDVYSATATTLTRCSLRSISAAAFSYSLTTDIRLSLEIIRMLSAEILSDREKIFTLGCLSAAQRLRRFIRELISEEDVNNIREKDRLELPLKSYELAEIIAVTPQHLYRLFSEPELRAFIQHDRGVLTLVNPSAFLLKEDSES